MLGRTKRARVERNLDAGWKGRINVNEEERVRERRSSKRGSVYGKKEKNPGRYVEAYSHDACECTRGRVDGEGRLKRVEN